MNTRWFFILAIFFLQGCSSTSHDDQRIEALAETYAAVANCKTQNKNMDSIQYQQRLTAVLKQHGFTQQQFQHDVEELCADPVRFHAFSDLALKKIQQQKP
jgi:hypothetical protein